MKHIQKGFTLMEMLIVVTIIGILAAVVIPRFVATSGQARSAAHKAERQMINSQLELYYFVFNIYPEAMSNSGWSGSAEDGTSETWADYFPEGVPTGCNQNEPWVINRGRIVKHTNVGGKNHE